MMQIMSAYALDMSTYGLDDTIVAEMVEALPATSRHSKDSPWLLPSGPDQVDEIPMREDQQSPHNNAGESNCPLARLQHFLPQCGADGRKVGNSFKTEEIYPR